MRVDVWLGKTDFNASEQNFVTGQLVLWTFTAASNLVLNRKDRRRYTINRSFIGDYINVDSNPALRALLNDKRERVEFADNVKKYDRRGKVFYNASSLLGLSVDSIAAPRKF